MINKKKILYIDMDGVIANFSKSIIDICPNIHDGSYNISEEIDRICLDNKDFFLNLEPIEDSIESIHSLNDLYEIYFLSTPMWHVSNSFSHKRLWIEKYFPEIGIKKLILTHRKDLNKGDYIIDDRRSHGVDQFEGIHIHYGTDKFKNWKVIKEYLINN